MLYFATFSIQQRLKQKERRPKMKTEKISFGARFLPSQTTKKMQNVLLQMNSQTEYKATELSFESKILGCIKTKIGSMIDSRWLVKPTQAVKEGRAIIELKKLHLEINVETGELFPISKKPLFSTWKSNYKKVEKFLDNLQSNFENKDIVEKRFLNLSGITQKGADKFREASSAAHKK